MLNIVDQCVTSHVWLKYKRDGTKVEHRADASFLNSELSVVFFGCHAHYYYEVIDRAGSFLSREFSTVFFSL